MNSDERITMSFVLLVGDRHSQRGATLTFEKYILRSRRSRKIFATDSS